MINYALRRLALIIPTLITIAVLVFFVLRVVPGDIVEFKLRAEGSDVSQEVIEKERERLGLNKPLIGQFGDWMVGLATLDLGQSMWTERPVTEEIASRLPLTIELAVLSMLIALIIAVPSGIIAAVYDSTWIDYSVRVFSIAGLAVPPFWLGMVIAVGLLYFFNWLPPITSPSLFTDPIGNLSQLVWPALAVGYRYAAILTRIMRSSVREVLSEDYIRTARAKGLLESLVIRRHALPNAMLPTITVIGLEFAFLIGGLIVVEQVFNLNGIGKLFVQAVTRNDFTLTQGIVMLIAVVSLLITLVVDMLYGILDPRIRYQ
jgi:peptide/nickel transport system permease protein